MPKLFFSPGACSLSPHIACREAELPFELVQVDLRTKRTKAGDDLGLAPPVGTREHRRLQAWLHDGYAYYVLRSLRRLAPEVLAGSARLSAYFDACRVASVGAGHAGGRGRPRLSGPARVTSRGPDCCAGSNLSSPQQL